MKPNIIFILIDDLGWRDLGCYGSTFYETPNIDRLAAEGMLFTDAYAACPVCSPTRASILTGRYPATIGVTNWIDWGGNSHPNRGRLVDVPYVKGLPLSEMTIASALRDAGYATWHVGKWHLGDEETGPEKHGFEVNVAGCHMGSPAKDGYFSPYNIPNLPPGPDGEYLTDRLTSEAIDLIENRDERPFFLNLWYYTVHTPIMAKAETIAKYEAKAKALGLDKIEALEEGEYFPAEHKKHLRVTRRRIQSDPVYAAMIEHLDENVGRLLRTLDEAGQLENTVIFFTSDNGGLSTAEGSPTSNAPLNEGKGWMYEGGCREPLLVRWPSVANKNSRCGVPISSPDFFPTLLEIAGATHEAEKPIEGVSLLPLLRGADQLERDAIFWHYPHYGNQGGTPGSSVRIGDYKLIEFFEDGRLELYNLREDIGEAANLVGQEPDIARALYTRLVAWREQVEAKIPQPNPDFEAWQ